MKRFPLLDRPTRALRSPVLLLVALIFFMADARMARAGGAIRVSIPAQSAVEEEWIYLGRIARVEGDDQALVERLQKVALANAPAQGQTRWLEPDTVRLRLRQSGIEAGEVRLQAPDRFAVTRGAMTIEADRIRAVVLAFLRARQPDEQGPPQVASIQSEEGILVPRGELSIRVVPDTVGVHAGRVRMALDIAVDGRSIRRTWATAELDQQAEVLVAARPLPKGQVIDEQDLALRRANLEGIPAGALSRPTVALGQRTRRALAAGAVISADLLDRPIVIKRGDAVLMLIESGGMRITARGIAKKQGRQGERIVVENSESQKKVYASVLDERTVRVDF